MIEIKDAHLDDLEQIFPLVREYYREERRDVNISDEELAQLLATMVLSEDCSVKYAVLGGEIAGAVGCSTAEVMGRTLTQEVFWKIADGFTKTKVGSRLFSSIEEEADERGSEGITVVALEGPHAKRVCKSYESKGYQPLAYTYIKEL